MVRFDGTSRTDSKNRGPRRPPNYLSARFQFRILTLVAALVVVMILMQKARQPDNWRWLWAFDQKSVPASPSDQRSTTEDQLSSKTATGRTQPSGKHVSSDLGPQQATDSFVADDTELPTKDRLLHDGWKQVRSRLSAADQSLLYRVMFNVRHGIPLSAVQHKAWSGVVDSIVRNWQTYIEQLLATTDSSTSPLNTAQKAACRQAAQQTLATIERLRAALLQAATPKDLNAVQRRELDALQVIFDQLDWARVADNSPLWRAAEYNAWYRTWERLDQIAPGRLQAAAQPVTYAQLFAQSNVYRGRLVRFRGKVRYAYRAAATKNPLGIREYYVLSVQLQPTGTENVRVYCRSVPEGFPEIRPPDSSRRVTQLDLPVEIAGYFFKRAVCPTTDGPHLCPVVLGKVIRYAAAKRKSSEPSGPSPRDLLIIGLLAALFGIVFSIWVYRRTSRPHSRRRRP